jgi:Flp pilus assembly protein TadD
MAVYLNFRVGEVRERDYFFVQNFMFMAVWTGVGAAWFVDWVRRQFRSESTARPLAWAAAAVVLIVSLVPMGFNWRTHDRGGFQIARDYAYNILNSLEPDALIFTNGDNDTFPLWYLQEVEGVRKDVRVLNLSLLNTDWYIKQLRDLEPRVPITYTDQQIADLYPYRDKNGRIWMVKDIASFEILRANAWKRPIYIAVTVPDHMGLDEQLTMEGLVFRIHPQPVTEEVDMARTLHNLNEVYRYDGLVLKDPADPNRWVHDTTVYKDDNASRLSQNYAAAYTRAALRLLEAKQADEALAQIQRAEAVAPNFPGTVVTTGIILEELRRFDEAEVHYRKVLNRYPGDWQIPYRLGETLVQKDRLEDALPYLEMSIQNAPADQYFPYQAKTSVLFQLNRYQEAAGVLERWLVNNPDDANVRQIFEQLKASIRSGTVDSLKRASERQASEPPSASEPQSSTEPHEP